MNVMGKTVDSVTFGVIRTKLASLVERHLRRAAHFTASVGGPLPPAFAAVTLEPDEQLIGVWRAPGLPAAKGILLTTLGVRGYSDRKLTFVPYGEISDLRMPIPDDPEDAKMHELMLYTRAEQCIFFPLFDTERDHEEAGCLFQFLSSLVAISAQAAFMRQWEQSVKSRTSEPTVGRPRPSS